MDDKKCSVVLPYAKRYLSNEYDFVLTPWGVAKEQIDMLPEEVFNPRTTFLDIYYKNEVYLKAIEERLLRSKYMNVPGLEDLAVRLAYIRRMQLYAISTSLGMTKFLHMYFKSTTYPEAYIPEHHILKAYNIEKAKIGVETSDNERDPKNALKILKSYLDREDNVPFDGIFKEDELHNFVKDTYNKRVKKMKFDVVVGNPPYNNDIYLDFVTLGHSLSSQFTSMITPAKWQAKTDGKPKNNEIEDKNERFRSDIVPYMSNVVYYKDSTDIFNIKEWGGISYFLVDKKMHKTKRVLTRCMKNAVLNSESFEEHDEDTVVLLSRQVLNVLGKFGQLGEGFRQSLYVKNTDSGESSLMSQLGEGFRQSLYVKNTDSGESSLMSQLGFKRFTYTSEQERGEKLRQADMVEVMQGSKVVGYKKISDLYTTDRINKYKCICSIMPGGVSKFDSDGKMLGIFSVSKLGPFQVPKGSFPILMYFDNEEQLNSFCSYLNTKSIAFVYNMGTCGTTLTKEFFRFVPNPNDWTCTYVDAPHDGVTPDEKGYYELNGMKYCSLYARYKLNENDINIIESIIKPRT